MTETTGRELWVKGLGQQRVCGWRCPSGASSGSAPFPARCRGETRAGGGGGRVQGADRLYSNCSPCYYCSRASAAIPEHTEVQVHVRCRSQRSGGWVPPAEGCAGGSQRVENPSGVVMCRGRGCFRNYKYSLFSDPAGPAGRVSAPWPQAGLFQGRRWEAMRRPGHPAAGSRAAGLGHPSKRCATLLKGRGLEA